MYIRSYKTSMKISAINYPNGLNFLITRALEHMQRNKCMFRNSDGNIQLTTYQIETQDIRPTSLPRWAAVNGIRNLFLFRVHWIFWAWQEWAEINLHHLRSNLFTCFPKSRNKCHVTAEVVSRYAAGVSVTLHEVTTWKNVSWRY